MFSIQKHNNTLCQFILVIFKFLFSSLENRAWGITYGKCFIVCSWKRQSQESKMEVKRNWDRAGRKSDTWQCMVKWAMVSPENMVTCANPDRSVNLLNVEFSQSWFLGSLFPPQDSCLGQSNPHSRLNSHQCAEDLQISSFSQTSSLDSRPISPVVFLTISPQWHLKFVSRWTLKLSFFLFPESLIKPSPSLLLSFSVNNAIFHTLPKPESLIPLIALICYI